MIYFKRFLFGIVTFCSILFGTIGTLFLLATTPIWMFIYYIITGKDPINEDFGFFCWKYAMKFADWSRLKLNLE
jgi:hypothetical protein